MRRTGPWDAKRIEQHLEQSRIPLRLACSDGAGWPVVVSLWYLFDDGALWCATPAASRVAEWLAREPRCGFEVAPNEPPYFGVRGQGTAALEPAEGARMLRRLAERYLGNDSSAFARWLLARQVPEVAVRITPTRLVSWDFSKRMRDV